MENELIEREQATCKTCSLKFMAALCRSPFDATKILARQQHCDPCIRAEHIRAANEYAKQRKEDHEKRIADLWATICPAEYRTAPEGGTHDHQRFLLTQPDAPDILAHPFSPTGLIIRGATGTGKTRTMFRLLRVYHQAHPRPSIIALSSGQFDRQARDAAGKYSLTEWFERLAKVDCLFIDDIGKGKWTPATAGHFWELVDDRTKHHRPLYLTTNHNGETLAQAIGLDRDIAEPLIRRLREFNRTAVLRHHQDS